MSQLAIAAKFWELVGTKQNRPSALIEHSFELIDELWAVMGYPKVTHLVKQYPFVQRTHSFYPSGDEDVRHRYPELVRQSMRHRVSRQSQQADRSTRRVEVSD